MPNNQFPLSFGNAPHFVIRQFAEALAELTGQFRGASPEVQEHSGDVRRAREGDFGIPALFTAAFIPGFLLAASCIGCIIVRARLDPSLAPMPEDNPNSGAEVEAVRVNRSEWFHNLLPAVIGLVAAAVARSAGFDQTEQVASFIFASAPAGLVLVHLLRNDTGQPIAKGLLQPLIVVDVVLGSIYGGVTGITEATAMGVVATLALITIRSELNLVMLFEGLEQTLKSVGTILWVTFGATVPAGAYSLSGGNAYVANLMLGMDIPPIGLILIMMLIFPVLGMFMDWVGIVLLTMPVFMPIILKLGYDPVWFGILFSVNMQVAFLTPPFGSAAFYLKSVTPPEIDLVTIHRSFGPFIMLQLAVLALLLIFPKISLFLVR